MDPFTMVVLIVLITAIASVARAKSGAGHGRRAVRDSSGTYDYHAWSEGQKASDRQTKKELELYKLKKAERDEARKTYERIVLEKLDVMKTAISMGMEKDDLTALDARLEKLIGQKKLERLMDENIDVPEVTSDLMDADLQGEIDRLQRSRQSD